MDVDKVIHLLYRAALEPDVWQSALDAFGDLLGGSAIGMSMQFKGSARSVAYSRLDLTFMAIMAERYPNPDTNPMVAVMQRLPAAVAMPRQMVKSDQEYFRSGLYNDVLRPQGLAHAAVVCAHRSSECFMPLGIFRRSNQPEFSSAEYEHLKLLLPHLERAAQISMKIGRLDTGNRALDAYLDRLSIGILFLTSDGRVWKLNRAAEAVIGADDGLSLVDGELYAAMPSERKALHGLIYSAVNMLASSGRAPGGALALSRPSMSRPLSLLVAPLPTEGEMLQHGGAVVFVADPDNRVSPAEEVLADLFGLTPTQSKLTSLLAAGMSLENASALMGIKTSTARVHLKKVFERTNTSRQAELVHLVLNSAASLAMQPF